MTDLDMIQANQAMLLSGVALLLCKSDDPKLVEAAKELFGQAKAINEYLSAKQAPLPSLTESVRAMKDNPWPDDVDAACRRAGKEEEP